MIKFQQVSKAYRGGRQALKSGLSPQAWRDGVQAGTPVLVKVPLLKLICAIERPTDGRVWFNDHDITRIPTKDIPFYAVMWDCLSRLIIPADGSFYLLITLHC